MIKQNWKAWLRTFAAMSCVVSILSVDLLNAAATDVDKLEQETTNLENELDALQDELKDLTDEITTLTHQMEITNESIEKTELDLAAAKLNEDIQYEAMKKRIKFMYETGNPSFADMLFDAENMADFLNKTEFVKNITEYDKDLLQELKISQLDIEKKEEMLIEKQDDLEKMQKKLNKKQKSLESTISSTKGKLKSSSDELKRAKAAQKAAEEAKKAAEEALKEAEKNNASNSGSTNSGNKVDASTNDLVLFAALLQCEAGTSNYDALLAVATVVMNRVESGRFPNSLRGVIYQSGQFSPTWNGSLKRVLSKGPCSLAYEVAEDALDGRRLKKVEDCLFFNAIWATTHNGVNVGDNIFW